MNGSERGAMEAAIRKLCERGEHNRAAELALQAYGPEILKFILSVLHHPDRANDVFSTFREHLLKGLPKFRWQSTLRTWSYRIARNDCYESLRSPSAREEPMSHVAPADEVQRERSQTRPWLRTDVKDRFRALREKLDANERALLFLRVDQQLSWTEVARILAGPDEALSRAELERRATALRQQFQRLKQHLRALAVEEGIVSSDSNSGDEPADRAADPDARR